MSEMICAMVCNANGNLEEVRVNLSKEIDREVTRILADRSVPTCYQVEAVELGNRSGKRILEVRAVGSYKQLECRK